jgi:hypothetical protein
MTLVVPQRTPKRGPGFSPCQLNLTENARIEEHFRSPFSLRILTKGEILRTNNR